MGKRITSVMGANPGTLSTRLVPSDTAHKGNIVGGRPQRLQGKRRRVTSPLEDLQPCMGSWGV